MSKAKVIYLTGCTSGLGAALTHSFAGLGCTVVGFGRDTDKLGALRTQLGASHQFYQLDIGSETDFSAVLDPAIRACGTPDLLINNAATITPPSDLCDVEEQEFTRVLNVNLFGTFRVIRCTLPHMVARGSGVIVNMSSSVGRRGTLQFGAYATSKWGVEGMTACLACEFAERQAGVAALTLDPGAVNTRMLRDAIGESASRFGSPEEWAALAAPALLRLDVSHNGRALGPADLRELAENSIDT